jgi:hypothetical protein
VREARVFFSVEHPPKTATSKSSIVVCKKSLFKQVFYLLYE